MYLTFFLASKLTETLTIEDVKIKVTENGS
jgi:hypothetical protein